MLVALRFLLASLLIVAVYGLDSRWKLVWSDEFNGNSLDTSKWTARDQSGYLNNGELEWNSPSQVSVAGGNLVIKSNPDISRSGYQFASGYLDTGGKFATTYGRYEIYAKLPYGKGLWPAHWLVSESLCWPVGSEIDILESISKPMSQIYGTYHYGTCCGCNSGNGSMYDTHVDLSQGYHTYAVEWSPTALTWYWDNVAYKTITSDSLDNGKAFPIDGSPHHIILNTAVGGYWPGNPDNTDVWPQYHYVDYVRVYAWQPCVTGCGHGCCDIATATCKCDFGYTGTNCEWNPTGSSYTNTFVTKTSNDNTEDNAAISNGLAMTVSQAGCPGACGGNPWKGGNWKTANAYVNGNITFVAKPASVSGAALILLGIVANSNPWEGFQLILSGSGSVPNVVLQTFGSGAGWWSFPLGYDASQAYHTYMVSYINQRFALYVDGKYLTTVPAPTGALQIMAQYNYAPQYFGTFTATSPVTSYVQKVTWTLAAGGKAVCPTAAPTPTPTLPPTLPPTPKPTPCPGTYASNFQTSSPSDSISNGYTTDENTVGFTTGSSVVGGGRIQFTISNANCPSSCYGASYSSGGWSHNAGFSKGTYNFTVQGPSTPGTAFILAATGSVSNQWEAVRIFLIGSSKTQVSFDTFVNGKQYSVGPVNLPFDHSSGYHTFGFTYPSSGSINFYANGKFLTSTTNVPSSSLVMQATFEAHPSWWGPLTYTGPTSSYLSSAVYSPCNN